jgi:general stress protein 26
MSDASGGVRVRFAPLDVSPPEVPDVPQSYLGRSTPDRLLAWDFVVERLESARYYWLASASPAGQPHVVPLWGIYFEGRICVDGHPATRWMRNLERNPDVVVHLPDAEHVVIVNGTAERLDDDTLGDDLWQLLDDRYRSKYGVDEGSPWLVVHPGKVLAWNGPDLSTMTRWLVSERAN